MTEGTIEIPAGPYVTKTVIEWVTMRDQFAMAALTALISETEYHAWDKIPSTAYAFADLMLEARKEKK
jgi:hypothetical protein